jgi:hypothetical protein
LYGTLLAWTGTGALVFLTAKWMGVNSIAEFSERMKVKVPRHTQSIGPDVVRPFRRYLEEKLVWMKRKKKSDSSSALEKQ